MKTISHARKMMGCGAALGVVAAIATGCLEIREATEPDLGSAASPLVVNRYTRWDFVPDGGNSQQIRLIGNADGRLALFSRTSGGTVRFQQQVAVNSGWTAMASFDGAGSPDMEVAREADGRLGVFALGGGDRAVYYRTQTSAGATTFTAWTNLGAGTPGSTDMEVGQYADGRLVVFTLGGDKTIWARTETTPGGGFGAWESHGGASNMMRVTSQGGRIALVSYTTVGTLYVREQPAANAAFGNWSFAGQQPIADLDVTRLYDGRLHLAWVAPSTSPDRALRTLTQSYSATWTNPPAFVDGGSYTSVEIFEQPTGEPIVFTTGSDGHARYWQGSYYGLYGDGVNLAGLDLAELAPGFNQDGRLELFGRLPSGAIEQTWQTAAGLPGAWRPLPSVAPTIDVLSATPSAPLKNQPVDINWHLIAIPGGCTPTLHISDDNGGFYGVFSLTFGTAHDDTITRDTTYTAIASCTELENSGVHVTSSRSLLVRLGVATPPPPTRVQGDLFVSLFRVAPGPLGGAITWQGQTYGNSDSLLLSITNTFANAFVPDLWIGFLPYGSDSSQCNNPAFRLFANQVTTSQQLAQIWGSTSPAFSVGFILCSNYDLGNAVSLQIRYSYLQ
jgi:hypothetical protein